MIFQKAAAQAAASLFRKEKTLKKLKLFFKNPLTTCFFHAIIFHVVEESMLV